MTMWTRGSDWLRSPLPSLVTITECPVSAISMLAPVMPTSASKYFARSTPRASASSVGELGEVAVRRRDAVCASRNAASTSAPSRAPPAR